MTEDPQKSNGDQSGIGGLTEILKLQAEALARMSERMASQHAPPVGGHPLALPPRLDGAGGHLPIFPGDPSASEESLPVLTAFRKFLEAERRKARLRFVWMSVAFAIAMSGVIGGAFYFWKNRVRQLSVAIQGAQAVAADANVAARERTEAGEKAQRVAEAAAQSVTDAKRTLSAAQSNLAAEVARNLSAAQSNLSVDAVSRAGELDRLKEMISSLQLENAVLISQVNALTKKTDELRETAAAAETAERPAEPVPATAPERGGSRPGAGPPAPRVKKTDEPIRISAPGLSGAVQLRLPETP